jgi:hypothetical protein
MRGRKTDETKVDAGGSPPLSTNQGVEALLTISQATGVTSIIFDLISTKRTKPPINRGRGQRNLYDTHPPV